MKRELKLALLKVQYKIKTKLHAFIILVEKLQCNKNVLIKVEKWKSGHKVFAT